MKTSTKLLVALGLTLWVVIGTIINPLLLFSIFFFLDYLYSLFKPQPNNTPKLHPFYDFLQLKKRYLASKEWQDKRKLVLTRDNYTCQHCGSTHNLNVHHMRGYDLIPFEPISYLLTLCSTCHTKEHNQTSFPKTLSEYMNYGY